MEASEKMSCAEHLHLRSNHTLTLTEIRVLKAHLKSLRQEHSHLLNAYRTLKKEEIAKLTEKTENEILDVGPTNHTKLHRVCQAHKHATDFGQHIC